MYLQMTYSLTTKVKLYISVQYAHPKFAGFTVQKSLYFRGFSFLYENYVFFLCMIFAEIAFCPSINLKQPVMVFFFFTYQLSCGIRKYLIFSVPPSLLALKENPGPHFVHRLLFLINMPLSIMYLVMSVYSMYFSCNVTSRRY